jgi:hypothetical protein
MFNRASEEALTVLAVLEPVLEDLGTSIEMATFFFQLAVL